jgi:hypothetical protein
MCPIKFEQLISFGEKAPPCFGPFLTGKMSNDMSRVQRLKSLLKNKKTKNVCVCK